MGMDVHSMMPSLCRSKVSDWEKGEARYWGGWTSRDEPGLRAWQSAHRLLPGTLWTRSWRVFSLRACWRLLRGPFMAREVARGTGGWIRDGSQSQLMQVKRWTGWVASGKVLIDGRRRI